MTHFISCVGTATIVYYAHLRPLCYWPQSRVGDLGDLRILPVLPVWAPLGCQTQEGATEKPPQIGCEILDYAGERRGEHLGRGQGRGGRERRVRSDVKFSPRSQACLLQEVGTGSGLAALRVTSRSSAPAQPCGPRCAAIYKIPLWPSLWQGWLLPILKSTICSSVHMLPVPGDYVTALQA